MYLRYDSDRGKLDSRARRGIYLGPVPEGRRSVNILSLDTGKVVARSQQDCELFATDFPWSSSKQHADSGKDDDLLDFPSSAEGVVSGENTAQPEVVKGEPVDYENQEHKQPADSAQPEQQHVPQDDLSGLRRSSRNRSAPVDEYQQFLPTRRTQPAVPKPRRRGQHNPGEDAVNFTVRDDDSPTYREAMDGPEVESWLAAIDEELMNHKKKKTFEMAKTPGGSTLIGSIWVFKRKRGADGSVVRYKARLCAAGSQQKQGDSYDLTFAPTPKMTSLRMFFAFATSRGWSIVQLDVVGAFLIPSLPSTDKIYMRAPPGMSLPPTYSLFLLKALYGLHQSPRLWNAEINATLKSINFVPTDADPCVYTIYYVR